MTQQLPIFELPLALLPGEQLPLHIFEERYKRMVGEAIETGRPFGVLMRDAVGARSVGCTAEVTGVLQRFEDGRLDIVVTGLAPFRVLERFDDPEDPAAEVEVIEEAGPPTAGEEAESARRAFRDLAERASGERPPADDLADSTAYALAARVELPAETKQELLQIRDEDRRMEILARELADLRRALDRLEETADRARSNGKVRIRR
ncbi:MAG TPA: LON peptidase substrate-binding domain-containing protein [Solirubrobacterales bacterium]|nr:LON peptidase substrate-binding domain-containing protein [Solirubrobacterales bacterium]